MFDNMFEEKTSDILKKVIEKITPSNSERKKISLVIEKILSSLRELKKVYDVGYSIEVVGSYAKDTWLSGEADIDIFILFPPEIPENSLRYYGLTIARQAIERLGGKCFERYATHPYVEAEIEGLVVDIVPAYKVPSPDKIISPVDRTPFHTRYVVSRINEKLKSEIRLLKRFMKGIGVYGAEIKVQGFSGYLAELLVIYYGSFCNVLKNALKWRPRRVFIDIEHFYKEKEKKKLLKIMPGAMIVIDPVDKNRNVASALSIQKMCEFIAAAKEFLRKPSLDFFFPSRRHVAIDYVSSLLKNRGTDIIVILTKIPEMAEDVAWGQIYKSLDGLERLFKRFDFKVLSKGAWLSEKNDLFLLFELENARLPFIEKHYGPPVTSKNADSFLKKYLGSPNTLAGPYIEGDRWIVFRKRKYTNAFNLIRERYQEARLGKHILESLSENMKIIYGIEILKYLDNKDFREYFYNWLIKIPHWLKYGKNEKN